AARRRGPAGRAPGRLPMSGPRPRRTSGGKRDPPWLRSWAATLARRFGSAKPCHENTSMVENARFPGSGKPVVDEADDEPDAGERQQRTRPAVEPEHVDLAER